MDMKLIVGLGNVGNKYKNSRHNVGFIVLDKISNKINFSFKKIEKFNAFLSEKQINQKKIIFLKPCTYMNLSGFSIFNVINYYKITYNNILIVYDDMDILLGKIKYKEQGGDGGHNGIKSVIEHLKTKKFKRIKIGINRPIGNDFVTYNDYVLSEFNEKKKIKINKAIKLTFVKIFNFIEK